jgi:hypothetical protein
MKAARDVECLQVSVRAGREALAEIQFEHA